MRPPQLEFGLGGIFDRCRRHRRPPLHALEGPLLAIQRAIRLGEEEGLQLPLLLRRPCGGALVALAVLARSLAAVSTLLGLAARESLGAQPLVADAASDLNGATDAARKLGGGCYQIRSDRIRRGTADLGPASDQIDSDQIRWIRSDRIAQPWMGPVGRTHARGTAASA